MPDFHFSSFYIVHFVYRLLVADQRYHSKNFTNKQELFQNRIAKLENIFFKRKKFSLETLSTFFLNRCRFMPIFLNSFQTFPKILDSKIYKTMYSTLHN